MSKLITYDRLLPEKGIPDSRATLTRKKEPPEFPRCVRTSAGRVAWYEDEIDEHIASLERGNAVNYRARAHAKNPGFGRPDRPAKTIDRRIAQREGSA